MTVSPPVLEEQRTTAERLHESRERRRGAGWLARRPVEQLLAEAGRTALRRSLGPMSLVLMGVGAIIGAGIFVLTGVSAAQFAGPAISLSFVLAGVGCALAALCYAELAALLPTTGSAYHYTHVTLGEAAAWVVGWNIVLEYVFAASYVAVGWSGYLTGLLGSMGLELPAALVRAPLAVDADGLRTTGALINLPAVLVIVPVVAVALRGIGFSARVNAAIVTLKLVVLALFVIVGICFVAARNWHPFVPANTGTFGEFGWSGVVRGAAVVFVAYLGFDALAATAQEAREPQRTMPIGILGSLLICTVVYCAVSLVLTGLVSYTALDVANPLSVALRHAGGALDWLAPLIDIAAVIGLVSVLLVLLIAQPRVLLAMSRDGLLPVALGRVSVERVVPVTGTVISATIVAVLAGLFPIDILSQLVSLGTLSVFIAVCVGVMRLRSTRPDLERPFRVPALGLIAPSGTLVCVYLMTGLPVQSWWLYGGWMLLGLVLYAVLREGAARRRAVHSQ